MKRICNSYSVKKRKFNFFNKFGLILIISCICIISVCATTSNRTANINYPNEMELCTLDTIDSVAIYTDSITMLKDELTTEVHNYMTSIYPNTKMSAEHITNLCLEHEFDIPLLLSQAQLESQFGRRTGGSNSCFGVVSRRYNHVNESVNDYIRIMKKSYVNKRSVEACINSGFRVEGSKTAKYAEDPAYSKTISAIRSKIIKNTNIVHYIKQINELEIALKEII